MSGLFDKLQDELENRDDEGGISPLDLVELPTLLKKLMKHMLREIEVPFDGLWEYVKSLTDVEKMTKEDLRVALKTLTKQGWLIALGEKEKIRYRVNLRRKPSSSLSGSIWAALDEKIEKHTKADPTDAGDS